MLVRDSKGISPSPVDMLGAVGVAVRVLLSASDGAPEFTTRRFEPGRGCVGQGGRNGLVGFAVR